MHHIRRVSRIVGLAGVILLAAACGTAQVAAPEEPAAPVPPKDPVTIQMSWIHEYSSAELYLAEANGHFAGQNLEVTVKEGGFQSGAFVEPIDAVLNGEADFGQTSGSALLQARAEGKPVVAVMSGMQRSPFALISLPEKNVIRPQDLVGHTVAVSAGGASVTYNSLLTSQGIDPSQVDTVQRTEFGIEPLMNGEVDVIGGWIINEAVMVEEAGIEPNVILVAEYGIEMPDKLYFTTEDVIQNNPALVERVVRALVAGMQDVVDQPEQAVSLAVEYGKDLDPEAQMRRLEASLPLINPAGSQLGTMDAEIWTLTYDIMRAEGLLATELDVEDAYTTQFLDTIYGG